MGSHFTYLQSLKNGTANPVEKKKVKAIAPRSKKRIKEQKQYVDIVKEMMAVNNLCEIKEPNCDTIASGLHHKIKRSPKTFLDRNNLIRACSSCQLWVELHPVESIAKGYSISKFKKD